MGLGTGIPVYVTRKAGDGKIGTVYFAAWYVLLTQMLIMANVIGWGIYGIVELVEKAV